MNQFYRITKTTPRRELYLCGKLLQLLKCSYILYYMWKSYKSKRWSGLSACSYRACRAAPGAAGGVSGSFLLSEGAFMVQASQSFFKNGLIVELASAGAVLKAFTPCQWATCWELPLSCGCKEQSLYGSGKSTRSSSQGGFICCCRRLFTECLLEKPQCCPVFLVALVSQWLDWVKKKKTFVIVVTEASQACSRKVRKTKKLFSFLAVWV